MAGVNDDKRLFDAMIVLKRHLRSCKPCHHARQVGDPYLLCVDGIRLTLNAADRYDHMISLRAKALRDKTGTVFACPDLSKHGKSYAMLAAPLHVTGVQEGMF